ncbi:phosphatidylinositol-4- kinase [Tilletia horrida]|uniref:1-phosphatidylinositol 4-kinase n=1 Tax=Tilletia horrida TaxID=155126 RepID=A0AAN6GW26_9BASI|nr:phosphatidylinositol-4- kinase [Tilletia horrida]
MDSLDLPTSQLILNALALNLAQEAGAGKLSPNDTAFLRNNTASTSAAGPSTGADGSAPASGSRYLTAPAVRTYISLALFASSISSASASANADQHLEPVLEDLISLTQDLTNAEFEHSLAWANWPLPDQLTYALVSALLQIGTNAPQHRKPALDAVTKLGDSIARTLNAAHGDAHVLITKHVPLFHGFYRALKDTKFPWSLSEFARLASGLAPLTGSIQSTRRLNDALLVLPEQNAAKTQGFRATRRKARGTAPAAIEEDDETRSIASTDTFDAEGLGQTDNDDGGFFYPEETGPQEQLLRNYRHALLSHYRRSDRPLSGHFVLYGTLDLLAIVLSQTIKDVTDPAKSGLDTERPAEKPASTGSKLLSNIPVVGSALASGNENGIQYSTLAGVLQVTGTVQHAASRSYHDLQRFVETEGEKQSELFLDIYSVETLAAALKLGAYCSVTQTRLAGEQLDTHVLLRVRTLLSEQTFITDELLQGAALETVSLLVTEYPSIAMPMTTQLRRFVTSPSSIFELDAAAGLTNSPILEATARCLAECVKSVPGDDLVISTMYSLLNYLGREATGAGGAGAGATGSAGGVAGSGTSVRSGHSRAFTAQLGAQTGGTTTAQQPYTSRTEDQKRLIVPSTISAVSLLALEYGKQDVIALATSMLLQRLRTADPLAESAILHNLVPLAVHGPRTSFIDVIRTFTQVSRTATDEGGRGAEVVQAAQLKLARALGSAKEPKPDGSVEAEDEDDDLANKSRKEIYLYELLNAFTDKGLALQTAAGSIKASKEEIAELNADLGNLVPAIAALLAHDDLNPQKEPTTETTALFRNMWFLAVLFGHATPQHSVLPPGRPLVPLEGGEKVEQTLPSTLPKPEARAEVLANAFRIISRKTPTLVPEKALNYLESDLEYNSVLRRDFSQSTLEAQRKALAGVIPAHAADARTFSPAQVTFLMTTYILENMRSAMGQPSMVLWYFVNDGLNSSALVGSLEDIADKVIVNFIQHLSAQINDHALDPRVSFEVKNLLLGSCHRVAKVRQISRSFLDKLLGALPSLLCDPDIITTMLEMLTLLRHGCECEYKDEYAPKYRFESRRANISFDLSDNYLERDEILTDFLKRTKAYLNTLMGRAPVELRGILQLYLGTFDESTPPGNAELGKSVALDFARLTPASARQETFLPKYGGWRSDASSSFVDELTAKSTYLGEMTGVHLTLTKGLMEMQRDSANSFSERSVAEIKLQLLQVSENLIRQKTLPFAEFRRLLYRTAALAVALPQPDYTLLAFVVAIPIRVFTPAAITTASHVWTWIIGERPEVETKIMVEITVGWSSTVKLRRGIFSDTLTQKHPLLRKTEMSPFNRAEVEAELELAHKMFTPHLTLVQLMASRYQAFRYRDPTTVLALVRLIQRCAAATKQMSGHPLAREARFSLIIFGFRLLQGSRLDGLVEYELRNALYKMAFAWFAVSPQWTFGSNYLQVRTEMQLMTEFLEVLKLDKVRASYLITSYPSSFSGVRLPGQMTVQASAKLFNERRALLQLLLENELSRFSVWANPLHLPARGTDYVGDLTKTMTEPLWAQMAHIAWKVDPCLAVQLVSRFKVHIIKHEVGMLVRAQPQKALEAPGAVEMLLEDHLRSAARDGTDLKWLHYWAPITPVEAITLFKPLYENHPMVLQYAMRTLEQHPVQLVFFYVPQVVQALRDDKYGYVEQFIFETSKISQLFCHQIIWNMKANSYKDGEGEVEDGLKPTLDRVQDAIIKALSGEARRFYEREFTFFNEVTGISGKLKPYIKKSKLEKKAKIDEEMAKIKVDAGVYLPSNPDGVVVDLDRKSGRPLQSHAKAPYMATFKVRRDVVKPHPADHAGESVTEETGGAHKQGVDVWQSAIFKVGDDCRQDVLALQVIAMFKNIFTTAGVDLYLNPYRVTATGPGCGVIDVVPNATSRDEMGRAKVNNLLAFFIDKYGNPDSIAFQKARLNFIQSMAAYSLACYILQIKDRHNGNIMIDGDGHIIHIDFGFLFDIGPGGVKFEPNSFKLSRDMIDVMGGGQSQGFKMFCELVTKSFLAIRPYAADIISSCELMLGTELPSFKGPPTIERLRDRFKLELTEREAAKHVEYLIKDAKENPRSTLYDGFQYLQNRIPF